MKSNSPQSASKIIWFNALAAIGPRQITAWLGEVPIVQSIREAGDYGRPAAMQEGSVIESVFQEITRNVVQETVNRNESLPATEAIKITTMAGCSAVKK